MARVEDFHRYVLPFIANAPVPAVDDAIVDACIEFCTKTKVLRSIVGPMALLPRIDEYEIDPPEGDTVIKLVTTVWLPDGQIPSKTRPELDAAYPQGWANLETADPRFVDCYHCRIPGIIRLVPKLSVKVARAMTIEVAYAPSRQATEVDDVLLEEYAEVIAAGALGRLHQHPGAEYAEPSRVATYLETFRSEIARCADDGAHGFTSQPLRTGRDEF
ncbi:MAG: hypothetical protein CML17_07455 [Pusillimonas sp.]|nr:hypothetical protein [Pusillimonas sp.]